MAKLPGQVVVPLTRLALDGRGVLHDAPAGEDEVFLHGEVLQALDGQVALGRECLRRCDGVGQCSFLVHGGASFCVMIALTMVSTPCRYYTADGEGTQAPRGW